MMLHQEDARAALGRGVEKLARAVQGTLGPRGLNVIIDRPVGTPIVSRDGVTVASEVELEDRFENMGAQVVREASMQTSEAAGDGTTTSTVLANAIVQEGLRALAEGANGVELVEGIERAVALVVEELKRMAVPLSGDDQLRAVTTIAATDPTLGRLVADALRRVGPDGVITVDYGPLVATALEVSEGMSFDRGFVSHHMATDMERMEAVFDDAYVLLTDQRLATADDARHLRELVASTGRPLLVIADEIAPEAVAALLRRSEGDPPVAAIHPPEYGHWRKAMLEDLAILTGGRVIARDLGGRIGEATRTDLGRAGRVRVSNDTTVIGGGGGDPTTIAARRAQIQRQHEAAPPNVERDKLQMRLSKLTGGTAVLRAGGATPVEQKRTADLLEDALAAGNAALEDGIVAGGGTALVQAGAHLIGLIASAAGSVRDGAALLQRAVSRPLAVIAENAGLDADEAVARVAAAPRGTGLNARTGDYQDLIAAGVIDPVKVTYTALRNAASVASLILTTHTLIADKPESYDPTAGPALGGGAELLGRA